jgi:hypothetical protein
MQDIFSGLIIIVFAAITLVSFFLAVRLLFPLRVELIQQAAEAMHVRAFFLGLVNSIFFAALIMGLIALADGTGASFLYFPALCLFAILIAALAYGLTGVVQLAGARLAPDGSLPRKSVLGSIVLILGCLTPFVGWFGLFVYVGFLGLGAFILSFFRKEALSEIESE